MATEKQIAANRRNAQRSTGPRSAAGKSISSRNALRHGLSLPAGDEAKAMIDQIAQAILESEPGEIDFKHAQEWAAAQWDINRVKHFRRDLLAGLVLSEFSPKQLHRLLAGARYEHRAQTRRRRAATKLSDPRKP